MSDERSVVEEHRNALAVHSAGTWHALIRICVTVGKVVHSVTVGKIVHNVTVDKTFHSVTVDKIVNSIAVDKIVHNVDKHFQTLYVLYWALKLIKVRKHGLNSD